MTTDVTLTSLVLNPWDGSFATGDKIALSYADLDYTPSASDPLKSTSGDVFKVYIGGVRIYRSSDQEYASGSGFLEDGDVSGQTLNGQSAAWTATSDNVWTIETASQRILLDKSEVLATSLYGSSGLNISINSGVIIELRRAVQDLKTTAVDFSNASILTEQDLDNSAKNVFHVAQQAVISTENAMLYDSGSDTYKATQPGTSTAKRISNVATPTSANDAANKAYVDGGSDVQTVASISNDVTTVAGISSNVTSVAGNATNINAVAADATDIGTVAGKATEIALLGTSAMATANTGHIPVLANVIEQTVNYTVTVASSKFNIQGGEYGTATETPALTLIRGYTYVFDTSDSTVATHPLVFKNGSATLGTSDGVTTTGTTGQAGAKVTVVVSDSVTITKYSCSNHGDGMGNTISLRHDDFKEVADNATNITSVANNATNINTVAGNNTNINTVAGISANVTTVASNDSNITSVAGNATNINTVATNATNVNNVGSNIASVNSVANNLSSVSNFGDTYHPSIDSSDTSRTSSTAAPGSAGTLSSLTEGDLWFDSVSNVMKVYDGSAWASASSSIEAVASITEYTGSQATNNKWFALTHDVGIQIVWLNGVRQVQGSDYYSVNSNSSTTNMTSGAATHIYFISNVASTDVISAMAFGQIDSTAVVAKSGGTFTGAVTFEAGTTHNTGSNTFTMPTIRGTDNYVLTRDDSVDNGSGIGTTWKETIVAPTISSVTYPTQNGVQATALAATGAQDTTAETLLINGQNLGGASTVPTVQIQVSGSYVTFAGTVSCNATGTVVTCTNVTKQASADNYTLRLTHGSNNLTATTTVNFSADPSFSTASGSLGTAYTGIAMSTKTITAGSSVDWYEGTPTMPTWMTHFSDGATGTSQNLTGTPTNTGTSEVQNFNIIIRDSENQSHNRDFSLTISDAPTGGTIIEPGSYTGGGYRSHTWTTVGTNQNGGAFVIYSATTVDILIVAGGGGAGGRFHSGGGGAGGVRQLSSQVLTAGTYNIVVGDGGGGGDASGGLNLNGSKGSNSSVIKTDSSISLSATGGGFGAAYNQSAGNGGSGGGGNGGEASTNDSPGTGNEGNYTPVEGYNGVAVTPSQASTYHAGGGGGGASAVGGNGVSNKIADGGAGISNYWRDGNTSGTTPGTHQFGGGGVGSVGYSSTGHSGTPAATHGGGGVNSDGSANTGGGGGAPSGTSGSGSNGGSGIVVIRYAI